MSRVICGREANQRFQQSVSEHAQRVSPGLSIEGVIGSMDLGLAVLRQHYLGGVPEEARKDLVRLQLMLLDLAQRLGIELAHASTATYAAMLDEEARR